MSVIAIHQLLTKMSRHHWENGIRDPDFAGYICVLITAIKASRARRVLIFSKDRHHFLAGFLAALHAGVPVVLPQSDAADYLKDIMQPGDGLLSDQPDLAAITSIFIDLNNPGALPTTDITSVDPSKATVIFYTSGSTGYPKAVSKKLIQLENEVSFLQSMWGAMGGTFFSTVPHYHIYGLLFSLLWPICGGYRIMCQTMAYWEDLINYSTSLDYIITSPSHLGRFPEINGVVGKIFSSGAPLPFAAAQVIKQHLNHLPIEVYGSTETGGIAYRQQSKPAQPWTRFKNVQLRLEDDQTLSLKSPYLPDNIFYPTQDRVEFIDDEHFQLIGRADRVVKVEGKRVCLLELENKLIALNDITAAAVVMLNCQTRDQLGAVIVLSPWGQEKLSQQGKIKFVRHIRQNLSLYFEAVAIPRQWRFVAQLPLNAQGKTPHALLQSCFAQDNQ